MTTPNRGAYELLHNYPRLRRPPKPHPRFDWPDKAKTMLRSLWAGQMAVSEIAEKLSKAFDYKITRNMIIGKAQRLNLEPHQRGPHIPRLSNLRGKAKPRPESHPASSKPQKLTIRAGRSIAAHVVMKCSEVMDLPPEVPSAERKTILELTNATCRWPIGDPGTPGFCFCGIPEADMEQKRPYCNAHSRMACTRSSGRPFVPQPHNTGARHHKPALLYTPNDSDWVMSHDPP